MHKLNRWPLECALCSAQVCPTSSKRVHSSRAITQVCFIYLLTNASCAGGMDDGNWGSRYPGRSHTPGLSRMMSDNLGHRFPSVANPRRQYSEDLYDAPRGSLNLLSGPGASPLDVMLGEADLGRSNVQQVLQNSSYICTFTPPGNGIAKQMWPVSFMPQIW